MRSRAPFFPAFLCAGAVAASQLLAAAPCAAAALEGFLSAGALATSGGGLGWRDGGFGRLDHGSENGADEQAFETEGLVLLTAGDGLPCSFVLQAALRRGAADEESRAAGVAQAFGKYEKTWGDDQQYQWGLRLGFFFLPSSRENTEVGWSSPYTLTYSALNTWIGEEVRPTGIEASFKHRFASHELTATGLVFGGNDASGALVAWRGFAMSNRVALWGELLPLPPLPSLERYDQFARQRDDGSKSFGQDLDRRAGYFFALRWQKPERFLLQVDHWDNRGDRHLYRGEYAWATRYDHVAFEFDATPELKILGEWLGGETGMGQTFRAHVDVELEAAYLLASWHRGPFRLSVRRDEFEVEEYDGVAEANGDQGEALTAAAFFDSPGKAWRFGLEWLEIEGEHPAAAVAGTAPEERTRSLRFEVRYYFESP